jgi:outer membrane receptor protein involved in Fe transport
VRFEYVDMRGRENFNITTPALNGLEVQKDFTEALPGLTLSRRMNEEWSLYGGAQKTFAAPQAPQISITNNPQDISAQYAWNYELGSRTRTDDALFGSDLTLFWIDYSDRLVQDPAQFDVFVNAGSSRHRGAELALESDLSAAGLDGVSLWTSTAYVDSVFTNGQFEGNEFPGAPNWLASWGARYDHKRSGLWCAFDGTWVDEAFTDAANTVAIPVNGTAGIRPAYSLWNANVGWDAKLDEKNDVSVLIGGRNVFDEDYFEPRAARGIFPGAPASMVFQVGMTHRF